MISESVCGQRKCRFYQGVKDLDEEIGEPSEAHVCDAYPDGIPDVIVDGEDLHDKVRSDQNNDIVFEKIENE